ncbi:MAG: hypothetical protein M3N16_08745 [Actinomycetota bacterium]|nr:hypothetical protein [Actinomycetota bacterium]
MAGNTDQPIPPGRFLGFLFLYAVTIGAGMSTLFLGEYALAGLLLAAAALIATFWWRWTRQFANRFAS